MDLDRSAKLWGAIKAAAHRHGTSPSIQHAVGACQSALSAAGAGFAMTPGGGVWEPLLSSSPLATELEELQFTLGEGPSGDAIASGRPVLESYLSGIVAGRRWPAFAAGATERGIGAAFAFPVGFGAAQVGVLTVYRREPGPLSPELLQDALVYADALLVLSLDAHSGIATEADELIQAAFDARRAEVHQATGVVAAQLAVSVTEALARLRAHAYSSGQSLRVVAADVIAGRLRLETDTKETGSQHAELEQEDDS